MGSNKGSEKFKFVEEKKEENVSKNNVKKEEIVEEYNIKKPFYFGFKQRVIVVIMLIIIMFGLGSYLIINSYRLRKGEVVKYSETSDSSYEVCLLDNNVYSTPCLEEGMLYNSSLVNTIPINFKYNVNFSEYIDYQLYYHVVLYNKIFDKNNKEKVLYENKEILIVKTFVDKLNQKINIDTNVKINYKKYNDFVNEYKSKYSPDVKSVVEVVLYLDEYDEERSVASVSIPVGESTFEVKKEKLSNKNKSVEIENEEMVSEANVNMYFGSFLIIISLILDIILVRLVKATFTKKSKYDIELARILKTYDKNIVNATSDFKYDENKEVIKVESIKELVDASNVINKPIVYNKINNIKSDFILEDDNKIYKFTLKEADID